MPTALVVFCTVCITIAVIATVWLIVAIVQYAKGNEVRKRLQRIEFIIKKDQLRNDGVIQDADTVLADIMENADFEVTGLATEVFGLYKKACEKGVSEDFEDLFYALSGETLDNYIERCEKV